LNTEKAENPGTAIVFRQICHARNDVKVNVPVLRGLCELEDISFLATGDFLECG
jgi:hypothetical protein